jgi:hypothetical protein
MPVVVVADKAEVIPALDLLAVAVVVLAKHGILVASLQAQ